MDADRLPNAWRAVFGSTTSLAEDGSQNSVIDAADYVVWRHSFGQTAGSGSAYPPPNALSVAAPELSTLILMDSGSNGRLVSPARPGRIESTSNSLRRNTGQQPTHVTHVF